MAAQLRSCVNIVILGEGGTGKSSITLSYLRKGFQEEYDPTVEDSYTTSVPVEGFGQTDVELVDTAGQEEYRGLWGDSQIQHGDGFVFVYDITSRESLEQLHSFIHQVRKVKLGQPNATNEHSPTNNPFPFIIVGNKADLHDRRQVIASEGLAFARQGGGLFVETSAKLHANVDNAFMLLIKSILKGRLVDTRHRRTGSEGSRRGLTFSPNIQMVEAYQSSVSEEEKRELSDTEAYKQSFTALGRENSEFDDAKPAKCCCTIA